jgi:hypothetical protein
MNSNGHGICTHSISEKAPIGKELWETLRGLERLKHRLCAIPAFPVDEKTPNGSR